jgi:translation initiation factor IF-3
MTKYRFGKRALVIDETGTKLGEMSIWDARQLADNRGLDLVEISRQGELSVCKIMDEGKFRYEQKKKAKENKKHAPVLKEVKFSLRIDTHDEGIKVNHVKEFLSKGNLVRVVVEMRGREKEKRFLADEKMNHILTLIGDGYKIEGQKGTASDIAVLVRPLTVKRNEQQQQTSRGGDAGRPGEVSEHAH